MTTPPTNPPANEPSPSQDQASDKLFVQKRNRRPGLHALARKLGVSHTSVAMALRDDPRISQALRERVQKVAAEEGYISSTLAQSLVSGWTGVIGVVVPNVVSTLTARLIQGIIDELWKEDVIPLVLCSDLDVDREKRALEAIANKRANGVIISPVLEDRGEDHFFKLLGQHTPIVSVSHPLPRIDVPSVTSDDTLGGELATRHLIEQGHKHILHFGRPINNDLADTRREQAYLRVMKEAGLKPHLLHAPDRMLQPEQVRQMVDEYFATSQGKKTTAVFAFTDPLAYVVYQHAQERGLRIGLDLAVVGYGNTQITPLNPNVALDVLKPSLSTVEQHPRKTGSTAVQVLRQMIAGKPVQRLTLIQPDLLVKDSSRQPLAKNP